MGEREGPSARPPEPAEFPGLIELLDGVFRARGGSMARDYPRFITERNRSNLRVVVESGRVVSHAGIVVRDASLEGMPVRVALLGAVATHPEHRGRGHATACVRSVMERAVECGVDIMWISGDRGLYGRPGARPVGDDFEFDLSAEDLGRFARDDADVRPLAGEDLLAAAELYAHEAVRFVRPLEDWESAMSSRFAFDGRCCFLGAWESGRLAAYILVRHPDPDGVSLVAEYAGARGVLLASLTRALGESGARRLRLHLCHHDRTLGSRLGAAGLVGKATPTAGTVLVLRFDSFMESLRGRFLERSGESAASELSFAEEGPPLGAENVFRIACGPDVIRVEGRGALAEFLFARPGLSPGGPRPAAPSASVHLYGTSGPFRAALPAPALWYGLNFV